MGAAISRNGSWYTNFSLSIIEKRFHMRSGTQCSLDFMFQWNVIVFHLTGSQGSYPRKCKYRTKSGKIGEVWGGIWEEWKIQKIF